MLKSWISFLLPKDEYKEKMVLYFYSEGVVIVLLSLIGMIIYSNYFNISVVNALLIPIVISLFYISVRYIISGIEYTDVATDKRYKRKLKEVLMHILTFFVLMFVYLAIAGFDKWRGVLGLAVSIGIVWFFASFISLNRSYRKNRDLL